MGAYEAMRKLERLRKKILVFEYLPLVLVVSGFLLPVVTEKYSYGAIGIGGGLLLGLVLGSQAPFLRKEHRTIYKNTFVKSILATMLEDVDYDWNLGFEELDVMKFGIVKMGNYFYSEDYISASYKGVNFRQADVIIKNVTGSGQNRSTKTYFTGRMFAFDFSQKVVANVKIFSKGYISHLNLEEDKLEMEDVQFNNAFNVFSMDAHEAFYILTPQMMEKIVTINKRYPMMAFRFAPGKLYVGIVTGDSFDAKVGKKLSYPKEREKIKSDVQTITDIIEMIDLIRDAA
ncbi:MAG: DUF3137 domain-containing protein [Clostridium sp.]|nr:DUF3137 domain-containing protein [Clostridium sp.]MCM1397862.1 DUF3137 domain-containing protein [Clostridium sp.]MCM1459102.1 DUF3137 domain-containing protein [Bacteroides sp.]